MRRIALSATIILIALLISFWIAKPNLPGLHGIVASKPQVANSTKVGDYRPKQNIPRGSVTYLVAEAAELMPHFIQITVDPADVHVNDIQTLTVIAQDPDEIVSAQAIIQADHNKFTVELKKIGEASVAEVEKPSYYIDSHGVLAEGAPTADSNIALADIPKVKFQAKWKIVDTHDATYHTTFVLRDVKGRENSDTITWTDLCNIPASGNWSLSSNGANCTIGNATDGVDSGNATINAGYSLTINSGGTFAYTPGNSIIVNGGAINIAASGAIKKAQLYGTDNDGDQYVSGYSLSGSLLKKNTLGWDCYDSNANARPGQTNYFATNRGDGSFDYNCDGLESKDNDNVWTCTFNSSNVNGCIQTSCDSNIGASTPGCGQSYYTSSYCTGGMWVDFYCGGGSIGCCPGYYDSCDDGGSYVTLKCQ